MAKQRILTFSAFLILFISILFMVYSLGNFSELTGKIAVQGIDFSQEQLIMQEEWKVVSNEIFSLSHSKIFMAIGGSYGKMLPTRYSVESDREVRVYWVASETDCRAAAKGIDFKSYPECQPQIQNIYKFVSKECNLPSDSGVCIINKGQESAKISLIVQKKL